MADLDLGRTLRGLRVEALFGYVTHEVDLLPGRAVTILAGPNGCGKTHMLRLARAVIALDLGELLGLPFGVLTANYVDGRSLTFRRDELENVVELEISTLGEASILVNSDEFGPDESDALPPWVHRVGVNRWQDDRTGRSFGRSEMQRRYGVSVPHEAPMTTVMNTHPWLQGFLPFADPTFIDTKRLDSLPGPRGARDEWAPGSRAPGRGAAGRISQYTEQVRAQISEARRESLIRSQDADEKFASNLLKRARRTVRQQNLVSSYERLSRLSAELSDNGLAGKAISVTIPNDTNPTERRVLDLFLQDWERKLQPLLPVHRKVTALKAIINQKFFGKTLSLDSRGVLEFKSNDGQEVPVSVLSSGEQHLLALFAMLLFSANEGSVVFVDEPEISLHAAWKHAFIQDLETVAAVANLNLVIATHSTAVINGRWDLVQELGVE